MKSYNRSILQSTILFGLYVRRIIYVSYAVFRPPPPLALQLNKLFLSVVKEMKKIQNKTKIPSPLSGCRHDGQYSALEQLSDTLYLPT